MKSKILFFLTVFLPAIASANSFSFFRDASVSPFVPVYDFSNTYSLVLTAPRSQIDLNAGQQLCVSNATSAYMAIADWGDNKSNPAEPASSGNDAVTSPEIPIGPGQSACVSMKTWGPFTFLRTMTGGNVATGYFYGFIR